MLTVHRVQTGLCKDSGKSILYRDVISARLQSLAKSVRTPECGFETGIGSKVPSEQRRSHATTARTHDHA
jgi:hypothetical protein